MIETLSTPTKNAGRLAALGFGALALLSACGGDEAPEGAGFSFDDLGGGSAVIQVYQGPSESAEDRIPNGTYLSGQTAIADCVTVGRLVTSDPSVGESLGASDKWVRLADTEPPRYATTVYTNITDAALKGLPTC